MLVIAHRGLSSRYPENTIISFEQAISAGANAIECDVHQVGETFVVFHDFDLQRLTGVEGSLEKASVESIQTLRIKNTSHKIPSLQEVFDLAAGKVLLNLELKMIADEALFVSQLSNCVNRFKGDQDKLALVISSFNHPLLQRVKLALRNTDIAHKPKIGALIAHLPLDNAQYAIDMQADIAAIDADLVTTEFVQHARKHYLDVWCYTVNQEELFWKLLDMGVDGIFCDDVIWANHLLAHQTSSVAINPGRR